MISPSSSIAASSSETRSEIAPDAGAAASPVRPFSDVLGAQSDATRREVPTPNAGASVTARHQPAHSHPDAHRRARRDTAHDGSTALGVEERTVVAPPSAPSSTPSAPPAARTSGRARGPATSGDAATSLVLTATDLTGSSPRASRALGDATTSAFGDHLGPADSSVRATSAAAESSAAESSAASLVSAHSAPRTLSDRVVESPSSPTDSSVRARATPAGSVSLAGHGDAASATRVPTTSRVDPPAPGAVVLAAKGVDGVTSAPRSGAPRVATPPLADSSRVAPRVVPDVAPSRHGSSNSKNSGVNVYESSPLPPNPSNAALASTHQLAPLTSSIRANSLAAPAPVDLGRFVGDITRSIGGAGDYRVALALHPDSLGTIHATLSLRGNELSVAMTPELRQGHEALTHELDTLRSELARGGLNVNVTLHDHNRSGADGESSESARASETFDGPEAATTATTSGRGDGQIHVIL